jgi:hypothetical protein
MVTILFDKLVDLSVRMREGRRRRGPREIAEYVSWRRECLSVSSAYANWRRASISDTKLAYAAHLAALDREERAAIAYRRSLEREQAALSRRPARGPLGRAVDAVVSPDAGWDRETDLATG